MRVFSIYSAILVALTIAAWELLGGSGPGAIKAAPGAVQTSLPAQPAASDVAAVRAPEILPPR